MELTPLAVQNWTETTYSNTGLASSISYKADNLALYLFSNTGFEVKENKPVYPVFTTEKTIFVNTPEATTNILFWGLQDEIISHFINRKIAFTSPKIFKQHFQQIWLEKRLNYEKAFQAWTSVYTNSNTSSLFDDVPIFSEYYKTYSATMEKESISNSKNDTIFNRSTSDDTTTDINNQNILEATQTTTGTDSTDHTGNNVNTGTKTGTETNLHTGTNTNTNNSTSDTTTTHNGNNVTDVTGESTDNNTTTTNTDNTTDHTGNNTNNVVNESTDNTTNNSETTENGSHTSSNRNLFSDTPQSIVNADTTGNPESISWQYATNLQDTIYKDTNNKNSNISSTIENTNNSTSNTTSVIDETTSLIGKTTSTYEGTANTTSKTTNNIDEDTTSNTTANTTDTTEYNETNTLTHDTTDKNTMVIDENSTTTVNTTVENNSTDTQTNKTTSNNTGSEESTQGITSSNNLNDTDTHESTEVMYSKLIELVRSFVSSSFAPYFYEKVFADFEELFLPQYFIDELPLYTWKNNIQYIDGALIVDIEKITEDNEYDY